MVNNLFVGVAAETIDKLDGSMSLKLGDLIRKSNTEPFVRLNIETFWCDEALLIEKRTIQENFNEGVRLIVNH